MALTKVQRRARIRKGIRKKIQGTSEIPRVTIFRSNKGIYAQIIDDSKGHTLTSISSQELGKKAINIEVSKEVGKALAEKASKAGVEKVVFDRNGYLYHGNVKAVAEGAREGGLKF